MKAERDPSGARRQRWPAPLAGAMLADPRLGEQTYRLEKIRRGEPDPALMKPPADYSDGVRRSARPAASAPAAS